MGIDGNFAGGFAQGTQPITQGIRQDRRDAAQRAFKEKTIRDDRTAQAGIRKENQEIRSDEQFLSNIFKLQQDKRQQDRFLIEQGVGRSLQDSQRSNAQLSDNKSRTLNAANQLQIKQQQVIARRQADFAKNLAPTPEQIANFQREGTAIADSFSQSLRRAQRDANDANDAFNRGQSRLGELQEQFQGAISESDARSSLQNILTSPGGQAIQSTFGRDEERIRQLFGQLGEPTTAAGGGGAFGVATPSDRPFEVPLDTPEIALQKEKDVLQQTERTKQIAKQTPGGALRGAGDLALDPAKPDSASNAQISRAFRDIETRLSTIVNKPSSQKLDRVDVDALTVLFKNANALSDEELGQFALARQQDKPVATGRGLQASFATQATGSAPLDARIKALTSRITETDKSIQQRFFNRIGDNQFRPLSTDSLGQLISKQNAWLAANRPILTTGVGNPESKRNATETAFRDAVQDKTEATQQQNLLSEIDSFRQRLIK